MQGEVLINGKRTREIQKINLTIRPVSYTHLAGVRFNGVADVTFLRKVTHPYVTEIKLKVMIPHRIYEIKFKPYENTHYNSYLLNL